MRNSDEPPLGLGLAPGHDLGLERLAELHLLRQHHRLDDDFLRERQRRGHVVDVGAGVLGRLRHRERVAGVLPPVGRAARSDWPGRAGERGEGELERLRQVRARGRPTFACGRSILSVGRSGWSTTASSPNTMTPGLIAGLASPATDCAAKRYAFSRAARLTLSDMSSRNTTLSRSTQRGIVGLNSATTQHDHQRASQAERPAIPMPVGQREAPARLAAPVEDALEREQDQREQDEERPELALDRDRRRLRPRALDEGGERPRRQVRLLARS